MFELIKKYLKIVTDLKSRTTDDGLTSPDRELICRIRSNRLTYLSEKKLASLLSACRSVEEAGLPGIFIEAGCALGGSAILISKIKKRTRSLVIYDVFDMIPEPTKEDTQDALDRYTEIARGESNGIGRDRYYGYQDNLYDTVLRNLNSFGIVCEKEAVSLVKGLVQDTMTIEEAIAFAHVDVDWYEPVLTCLKRIMPNLVVGGSIILDDYHDWGGCKKAADEYFKPVSGQFIFDDSAGSMKITRIRSEG